MDPRHYVRPGERLRIAASQINALNAMMRPDAGFQADGLTGYGPLTTIILARNSTGADLDRWGVMKITGVEIDPDAGDKERRSFEEMPCVTGSDPDGDITNTFCVAVEPIKDGKIGRVAVAGVVQITAASLDLVREHVGVIWEGSAWALVRIGGGGASSRICKTTTAFLKNTVQTLNVWEDGDPPNEEQTPDATIADVVNKFADIPACSFVSVAKHKNGRWYVVAWEC